MWSGFPGLKVSGMNWIITWYVRSLMDAVGSSASRNFFLISGFLRCCAPSAVIISITVPPFLNWLIARISNDGESWVGMVLIALLMKSTNCACETLPGAS